MPRWRRRGAREGGTGRRNYLDFLLFGHVGFRAFGFGLSFSFVSMCIQKAKWLAWIHDRTM